MSVFTDAEYLSKPRLESIQRLSGQKRARWPFVVCLGLMLPCGIPVQADVLPADPCVIQGLSNIARCGQDYAVDTRDWLCCTSLAGYLTQECSGDSGAAEYWLKDALEHCSL